MIFGLAEMYGWTPAGTQPLADWDLSRPSDEGYFSNDFQIVTKNDALALATALETATGDLSDYKFRSVTTDAVHFGDDDESDGDPLEFWSGQEKKAHLWEFVAFCRRGAFRMG
jgi:hypothetical protein